MATVGITDHAQCELTDIVFCEVPAVGKVFKAGDPAAVVESVKTASDIYAPLSGTVIEANKALGDNPGLVNQDAFGQGWFFKLKLRAPGEVGALLTPEQYAQQISGH